VATDGKQLKVTLLKSRYHRKPGHAECVRGLGLRNRHSTAVVSDTPEIRGMIRKIAYMIKVEEA